MGTLQFQMRGSKGDVYDVEIDRAGDRISMSCTCEAGARGSYCHHRIELLRGDTSMLVSNNRPVAAKLPTFIAGTKLEQAMAELIAAEKAQAEAKKLRDRWINAVGRLMQGE
ncbi:MAG: hypothetical protein ABSA90_11715 [Xanthobacteraceae bacterium]|jgi:uncharacterized Zn finger protein